MSEAPLTQWKPTVYVYKFVLTCLMHWLSITPGHIFLFKSFTFLLLLPRSCIYGCCLKGSLFCRCCVAPALHLTFSALHICLMTGCTSVEIARCIALVSEWEILQPSGAMGFGHSHKLWDDLQKDREHSFAQSCLTLYHLFRFTSLIFSSLWVIILAWV